MKNKNYKQENTYQLKQCSFKINSDLDTFDKPELDFNETRNFLLKMLFPNMETINQLKH